MTKSYMVLDELLDDPMVQLVMKRDRVRPENLRSMIERAQARADDMPPAHMLGKAHMIGKECPSGRLCL